MMNPPKDLPIPRAGRLTMHAPCFVAVYSDGWAVLVMACEGLPEGSDLLGQPLDETQIPALPGEARGLWIWEGTARRIPLEYAGRWRLATPLEALAHAAGRLAAFRASAPDPKRCAVCGVGFDAQGVTDLGGRRMAHDVCAVVLQNMAARGAV